MTPRRRLRPRLRTRVRRAALRAGYRVHRLSRAEREDLRAPEVRLDAATAARLRGDHPRLAELRRAYADSGIPAVASSVWADDRVAADVRLEGFRGDNLYVWQQRQLGAGIRVKQFLVLADVERRDDLGLLDRCEEDGAFGATTFAFPGRAPVSRDLVDSVNELNFLGRNADLAPGGGLRVLDIGAGYGRLAHRAAVGLDTVARWDCVDAVPTSTFLCEFYLEHRGLTDVCRAVPLTEVAGLTGPYDLAVNVHSFPEMPMQAVRWWLDQLVRLEVSDLFVVPNEGATLHSYEPDGRRLDIVPELARRGYHLVWDEPVVADPAARELAGVHDHFLLFRAA